MSILIPLFSVILGLIILTLGGNKLVDGAVSLAKKLDISEAIIGLTVVAIGTSMPELIVSLLAAIQGSTDIAIGNVLGSNIANFFLILGITAVIARMRLSETTRFFDLPVVIFSTLLLLLLVSDRFLNNDTSNIISRTDGVILITFAVLYIFYSLKHNNIHPDKGEELEIIESNWKLSIALIGGIGALFLGGKILVDGAVDLAKMAGISESVIGLTIVAVGTSAPELATSIIAARRGSPELAIGNVVGSNIMNILIILGVTSFIRPIPFATGSFIDLLMALFAPIAVLILSLVWTRNEIGKREGILMLTMYGVYIFSLLIPYI